MRARATPPLKENIQQMTAKKASDSSKDLSNASFWTALNNQFTGNLDYQRSLESAIRAERNSALEAARAREWSAEQAKILRDWQTEMSNTAYSRAVRDLKSAGINPYAIGLFNQLSTPSGSAGQSFSAQSFAGNTYNTGSTGFRVLSELIQTLFKEYMANQRSAMNAISSII